MGGHFLGFHRFKVDFICVGAQKAGTSALDYYLRQHPQLALAKRKEVHFFDHDAFFSTSRTNYRSYHRFFDPRLSSKLHGEITPIYMFWDQALERIKAYHSQVKLIAILRNPVDRAFSHWNMEVSRGKESRGFLEAIQADMTNDQKDRITSYVKRGFYHAQVRNMLGLFPKEQLLFIKYEDFITAQEMSLEKVFRFLGVQAGQFAYEPKKIHARDYSEVLDKESKTFLLKTYENDILALEKTLDWDCSDWKV